MFRPHLSFAIHLLTLHDENSQILYHWGHILLINNVMFKTSCWKKDQFGDEIKHQSKAFLFLGMARSVVYSPKSTANGFVLMTQETHCVK